MKKPFKFNYLVIIISVLIFSCKKEEKNNLVELKINSNYKQKGAVLFQLEIKNNSENKIYFPILTREMNIPYHNIRPQETQKLEGLFYQGFMFLVYDSKGNIIPATYGDSGSNYIDLKDDIRKFDSIDYYFSQNHTEKLSTNEREFLQNKRPIEVFKYNTIKSESFFVEAKSKVIINAKSHLNYSSVQAGLLLDDLSFYSIDEIKEGNKIRLALNIDSTNVKKNLTKEFIDSLHQNHIKIFHGTIYSNKVPLEFEK